MLGNGFSSITAIVAAFWPVLQIGCVTTKSDFISIAWLLTKLGGLTQREVAGLLGLTTGAAVCLHLKRLKEDPWPGLTENLQTLENQIQAAYLIFKGPQHLPLNRHQVSAVL